MNWLESLSGQSRTAKVGRTLISILVCLGVGLLSSQFSAKAIPNWYVSLKKPPFNPPNWIFPLVWTPLYIQMGISFARVWGKGLHRPEVKEALLLFLGQLTANFLWPLLFFQLKSPLLALVDIVVIWGLLLVTIFKFYRISLFAAVFLIPYFLWVSFASVLNFAIIVLNP